MKQSFKINLNPQTVTKQCLKNMALFFDELSAIDGVEVNKDKLEITYDSDKGSIIQQLLEKYS
jgi:carbon monoxide dehydrogenase subunit G